MTRKSTGSYIVVYEFTLWKIMAHDIQAALTALLNSTRFTVQEEETTLHDNDLLILILLPFFNYIRGINQPSV